MKKIIVAIDGYSGTGKSSTAKEVARQLDYIYVDSGAMYRAVTYYLLHHKVDISNQSEVERHLDYIQLQFKKVDEQNILFMNGESMDTRIRTMEVNQLVSEVSTLITVRRELVKQQKKIGEERGIVMDGRDIGTVVFTDAELKVFMVASLDVRGKRRKLELQEKNIDIPLEEVMSNLKKRDKIDSERTEGPLKKAPDALEIDTSDLTFDQQVTKIVDQARKEINAS
ncbi:MAG: (d)CMP kinase [Cytophagales bacterium]|nr:(d)CMP kinase [Cytophagales bacterium]